MYTVYGIHRFKHNVLYIIYHLWLDIESSGVIPLRAILLQSHYLNLKLKLNSTKTELVLLDCVHALSRSNNNNNNNRCVQGIHYRSERDAI